jgi:hypothetical protein
MTSLSALSVDIFGFELTARCYSVSEDRLAVTLGAEPAEATGFGRESHSVCALNQLVSSRPEFDC